MRKKREIILLVIAILILIAMNYTFLDSFVAKTFSNEETIQVQRVIDGDTVVGEGKEGMHYRLLGINTPEKGEKYYTEAKNYTEGLVMNKTLEVETKGKDRYGRELAYLFYNNENINKEIVREGYANPYFPEGKDNYYYQFRDAWEECIANNVNLCEKSLDRCAECIQLREWNFDTQKVELYNNCGFSCNLDGWTIKDEGRKKFIFEDFNLQGFEGVSIIVGDKTDTEERLYWKGESYVWTYTGDTIFLRDREGGLVLWKTKGY